MVMSMGKIIICVLAMWLIVVLMLSGPLFHNNEPDEQVLARLTRAVGELESLKQQNEDLKTLLNSLKKPASKLGLKLHSDKDTSVVSQGPTKEYEMSRRKAENGVVELWYYMRSELHKLKSHLKSNNEAEKQVDDMMEDLSSYKRTILIDMEEMRRTDGYEIWRYNESDALSKLVQKRLNYLQNPKDCATARKLICNLNKGCGYGCQLHHAVYCLIMAYATERTMILKSKGWRYASEGWETVFKQVSDTCTDASGASMSSWGGNNEAQLLDVPIIDNIRPRPPFLPLSVPRDLSDRIFRLHGNPALWWISQMVKYLLRPQAHLETYLKEVEKKMDFKHPVVGLHVRRTDKIGTEAALHKIEEYMEFADDFFAKLELQQPVEKRRIYLATDEPKLLAESRAKYPNYVFYGDTNIAKSASLTNRYTSESLKGVILDIHMLSKCDYLVCTFSSQVCRVAYEIMQLFYPDASSRFHSLDDIYYFGGQNPHDQKAVYDHKARSPDEFDMKKGDILGIAGNHWNGFSKGVNRRTRKSGLYPSYKAVESIPIVDQPTYEKVGGQ